MRVVVALGLLAGCLPQQDTSDPYPYPPDPGWQQPPGTSGCRVDTDCSQSGSEVCARDYSCVAPSQVMTAHVTWTIGGHPVDATSCGRTGDLDVKFWTSDDYDFGFSPVPCLAAKFTIDKLPTWYTRIGVGRIGDQGYGGPIDPSTGNVSVDLPY